MSGAPPARRDRARAWIVLLALSCAGLACYRPDQPDCAIACGIGGLCPRGMHCSNGLCARGSAACSGLDAAAGGDVLLDAPWLADAASDAGVDVVPPPDAPVDAPTTLPDVSPADAATDAPSSTWDASPDEPQAAPADAAPDTSVPLAATPSGVMRDRSDPTTIELYSVDTFGNLRRQAGQGSVGVTDLNLGFPTAVMGIRLGGTPTAISMEDGLVHIFVRGLDKHIHQRWFANGAWQGWAHFDSLEVGSDPTAVTRGVDRLDLFARGARIGDLWHFLFDHGWAVAGWVSLGGVISSTPAVVALGERIDVFARDPDGQLVHLGFDGEWGEWKGLADKLSVGPAVISRKPGVAEVYGVRSGGSLEFFEWTPPASKGPWKPTGVEVPDDFRVVAVTPGRVLVLSRSEGLAWQRLVDLPE